MTAPAAGCTGKVAHPTFTAASLASKKLRRKREDARAQPYRCRCCHKFHVGENNDHGKRA